jgi:hypothetical protein
MSKRPAAATSSARPPAVVAAKKAAKTTSEARAANGLKNRPAVLTNQPSNVFSYSAFGTDFSDDLLKSDMPTSLREELKKRASKVPKPQFSEQQGDSKREGEGGDHADGGDHDGEDHADGGEQGDEYSYESDYDNDGDDEGPPNDGRGTHDAVATSDKQPTDETAQVLSPTSAKWVVAALAAVALAKDEVPATSAESGQTSSPPKKLGFQIDFTKVNFKRMHEEKLKQKSGCVRWAGGARRACRASLGSYSFGGRVIYGIVEQGRPWRSPVSRAAASTHTRASVFFRLCMSVQSLPHCAVMLAPKAHNLGWDSTRWDSSRCDCTRWDSTRWDSTRRDSPRSDSTDFDTTSRRGSAI